MSGFQHHLPALRAWFGRRLSNTADIDDAVQDVWLRVHQHVTGGTIENLQGYLFQTAQSVVTDRARKAAVRQEHRQEAMQDFHHPVEEITPDRVLAGKETMARIVARIAEMPERTREIFVLHRFEDVSYGEIAEGLGISVSAVEKHIMKALRLLTEERR